MNISLEEVATVTRRGVASFKEQKPLLRINRYRIDLPYPRPTVLLLRAHLPLHIVGDMHGQFRELRIILSRCGDPANHSYLFLGDYVDRGVQVPYPPLPYSYRTLLQGVETVLLVMALKIRYPDRVFMLRGNHEDCNTATAYGFYDECLAKFAPNGEAVSLAYRNHYRTLTVCRPGLTSCQSSTGCHFVRTLVRRFSLCTAESPRTFPPSKLSRM